jgi:hypothetical protein
MRAFHRIDMTFGGSFPKGLKPMDLPSFVKHAPATRCFAQPPAAMAADKWVAILTRDVNDMRVKEYADVCLLETLGTSASQIAQELERVAVSRQLPNSIFKPIPDALDYDVFMTRKERWENFKMHRRLTSRLSDVWVDLRGQWSDIHEQLVVNTRGDLRQHTYQSKIIPFLSRDKRASAKVIDVSAAEALRKLSALLTKQISSTANLFAPPVISDDAKIDQPVTLVCHKPPAAAVFVYSPNERSYGKVNGSRAEVSKAGTCERVRSR